MTNKSPSTLNAYKAPLIKFCSYSHSLVGYSTGYTETWSSVALLTFSNQLQSMQMIVKRFLEYVYKLHLALKNFDIDDVDVEFEELPEFNPDKKAEAELKKAQYITTLLQSNVITVEEAREFLGLSTAPKPKTEIETEVEDG